MIEALQDRLYLWKHRNDTREQKQVDLQREVQKIKSRYDSEPATRNIIELFAMLDALVEHP